MKKTNNPAAKLLAMMNRGPHFDRRVKAGAEVMRVVSSIHDIMAKHGITKAELADRLGVARSQVGRWFNDETGMNAKTIFMLADALDCDVEMKIVPRSVAGPQVDDPYANFADVTPLLSDRVRVSIKQPFARQAPLAVDENGSTNAVWAA